MSNSKTRILFVCMGNICRSPTAEAVFKSRLAERGLTERIEADSAGTHGYHIGHPPDGRAREAAARRGFDMSGIQARAVNPEDLYRFDYILAADRNNLDYLQALQAKHSGSARIGLLLEYAQRVPVDEVPDPYFGGDSGFERVLDLIEDACDGLLRSITATGRLPKTASGGGRTEPG